MARLRKYETCVSGSFLMLSQRGRSDEGADRCHGCLEKDDGIDAERIGALRPIHTDAWLVLLRVLLQVGR